MNKRIKTVYTVSIITMLLMLTGQAYWLYKQYQYSANKMMESLQPVCAQLLNKEEQVRYDMMIKRLRNGESGKDTVKIAIQIKIDRKKVKNGSCSSVFTYILSNGKKIALRVRDMDSRDANTIYDRYSASLIKPFQQGLMDSLLMQKGLGRTYGFKRVSKMPLAMQPRYSVVGFWRKGLRVSYCSNPMLHEGVEFTIPMPVSEIIRSMSWQLVLTLLLLCVLASCLYYQVKTIVIQKRIDALRCEFLKNIIFERKQPKEEPGDCLKVGDTEFRYGLNELRYGNERVILTSRQAEIFRLLASTPNIVVGREKILGEAWGDDSYSNSLALNVQISYLRRAIKSDKRLSIDVVYKKGYVLNVKD